MGGKGGNCLFCHANPTFSENQVTAGQPFSPFLTPVPDVEGTLDIRDLGFHNIGVKPYTMDLALGGTDPYGNPLSLRHAVSHRHHRRPLLAERHYAWHEPRGHTDAHIE